MTTYIFTLRNSDPSSHERTGLTGDLDQIGGDGSLSQATGEFAGERKLTGIQA
jgi:hypothetical protein